VRGAYICGEETALLESLEGKTRQAALQAAVPRNFGLSANRPPSQHAELCIRADHHAQGRAWFAGLGPPNSGGTMIFSMSGHVGSPVIFELPLGIPFKDLLETSGGCGRAASSKR